MPHKLTARYVEAIKPRPVRFEERDVLVTGLTLRVTPNGVKSWAVVYSRKSDGRKRRFTIGEYPAFTLETARSEAKAVLARVARGEDPAGDGEARKQAYTFRRLADAWFERHAKTNRTKGRQYDDRLMLEKDILPAIGSTPADTVEKHDVIRVADAVLQRGAKVRANRTLSLIRTIYRWGGAEGLTRSDPTMGIRKRATERSRDRVLTDAELPIVWDVLGRADLPMTAGTRLAIKLALVTGQRIGMIEGMRRDELDLNETHPTWTVSGARTKNRELSVVPLSPLAVALIREAMAVAGEGSTYIFPNPSREGPISAHAATRAMSRARKHFAVADFRIHDLRRTVATGLARLGFNAFDIGLVLDHVSTTKSNVTTGVYVKYGYDPEKRRALNRWAAHLDEIVSGKVDKSNVILMPSAAK